MKPYDLIIFDWDGTLIDSIQRIVDCFHLSFDELGLTRPDDEAIKQLIGLPLVDAFKILAGEHGQKVLDDLAAVYRTVWRGNRVPWSQMFGGVPELIDTLASDGYQLAIATGKSRVGLERELEMHALTDRFPETRCAEETKAKPDPEMLLELLTAFDVSADRALMIGDTDMDLNMARNAKIDAVAVTSGSHPRMQLEASSPVVVLEKATDLKAWLDSL